MYMQGANQHLPQNQASAHGIAAGRQPQQRGARRQWRDPSKSNERGDSSRSPINQFFGLRNAPEQPKAAYHNPFDLNSQSYGEQTNPSALVGIFDQRRELDRDNSPSEIRLAQQKPANLGVAHQ